MQQLQKAISFGERGHSAIVDRYGNTIAHPSAEWQGNLTNITKLDAVARMTRGESGVSRFYSPVMKGDMIAGFNTVPGTGWGVMVPQPVAELEERAGQTQNFALALAFGGLAVAVLLGWFIAGVLTGPVSAVVGAARQFTGGNLAARVPLPEGTATAEFRELSGAFNRMAESIEESQKQLAAALTSARVADRAKSEFLANTGHELRTPLNAIIGFSEIMESKLYGPLGDPRYDEQIGHIHDSGKHLLDIVNDLLDISRINSGNLELSQGKADPWKVIDTCVGMITERAEAADVGLHVDLDPGIPMAWADERALKQIVLNLLSNAVKFTPPGGSLTVTAHQTPDGSFEIQVSDTGIGMDMSDLDRVFEPFGQIDASLSRNYEGMGLGLPLAKALAEGHGGSLHIDSAPGKGTTVTLSLPPEPALAA